MKSFLSALALTVLVCVSAPAMAANNASNIVGEILEVEGKGSITNTQGQIYEAVVHSKVHPQDVITTGPGSRLFIQFIDNTEFTLSENAQFTVEEYSFDENDKSKNFATYSVLQGAFLYVSGLVAKKETPDVKVNVPQGSIGIRGTKFWGGMVDGAYGVIVGEGKVVVRNKAGSVNLGRGQGTTLKDRATKPTDATLWEKDKIAAATDTITLKNPEQVGVRMIEARAEQPILREQHKVVAATIQREPAEVLEQRVEEKMLKVLSVISPVTETEVVPEVRTKTEVTKTVTEVRSAEPETGASLRERLKQQRLNSVDQDTAASRLNATKETTIDTVRTLNTATGKTVETVTSTPTQLIGTTQGVVETGTRTTTETVRETVNAVDDTGKRVISGTVETTTTVKDAATDTVKATTDVVKQVTETPVVKDTTDTVRDIVKPTVTPATDALNNLKKQRLLGNND